MKNNEPTNRFCAFVLMLMGLLPFHATQSAVPTLHLITVCSTDDTLLKQGFLMNRFRLDRQMDSIAARTRMKIQKYPITHHQVHVDTILAVLKKIKCGADDVIWFHYSGHGINQTWSGKYPMFLIPQGQHPLAASQVQALLAAKKPRLLWMMMDCCNHVSPFGAKPKAIHLNGMPKKTLNLGGKPPSPQNYKQLFLKSSGTIWLTAAKQGQVAYTHESVGGILTVVLTDMLQTACANETAIGTGWQVFLEEVARNTTETAWFYDKKQEPYFQIQSIEK